MSRGNGELPRFAERNTAKHKWWLRLLSKSRTAKRRIARVVELQNVIEGLEEERYKASVEIDDLASELAGYHDFEVEPYRMNAGSCEAWPAVASELKNPKHWLNVYALFCAAGGEEKHGT